MPHQCSQLDTTASLLTSVSHRHDLGQKAPRSAKILISPRIGQLWGAEKAITSQRSAECRTQYPKWLEGGGLGSVRQMSSSPRPVHDKVPSNATGCLRIWTYWRVASRKMDTIDEQKALLGLLVRAVSQYSWGGGKREPGWSKVLWYSVVKSGSDRARWIGSRLRLH